MFWFKPSPVKEVSVVDYVIIKYGTKCVGKTEFGEWCVHDKTQHACVQYVDHVNSTYYGCNYCSCKLFTPLSPLELAVLIEEEHERRKNNSNL